MPAPLLTDDQFLGAPAPPPAPAAPVAEPTAGLSQDPANPNWWRDAQGRVAFVGQPGSTNAATNEITIGGSSNPAFIASQTGQQPAAPPPAPDAPQTDAAFLGAPEAAPAAPQPPAPKGDVGLGLLTGALKPFDTAAQIVDQYVPGMKDVDAKLAQMTGTPNAPIGQVVKENAAAQGKTPDAASAFAGNVVGSVPIAMLAKSPLLSGALVGATSSDNPRDLGSLARDTAFGAVGGKLGEVALNTAGKIIAPKVSEAAKALMAEGVNLTHGQTLGGTIKHIEDGLSHVPVLGDLIKNAQARSLDTFNRAVVNRTLAPLGESLPANIATGNDAFEYAADRLGKAYGDLLPTLNVKADAPFAVALRTLRGESKLLPEAQQTQFSNIIDQWVARPLNDSGALTMTGDVMKTVDSELGRLASTYSGSAAAGEREMGNLLAKTQGALRDMVRRGNPAEASVLDAINKGWASLVRVRGATASIGAANRGGVFTPANLMGAVKAADKTAGKGSFAKGKALMQDIAQHGQELLPSSVPDSGTAGRGLLTGLLLGGSHAAHILLHPPTGIPLAALSGAYTKVGAKGLAPLLVGRPAGAVAVRRALTKLNAPAALAGANAARAAMGGLFNEAP